MFERGRDAARVPGARRGASLSEHYAVMAARISAAAAPTSDAL